MKLFMGDIGCSSRGTSHGEYELRLTILDEISGQILPVEADKGVKSHVFAEASGPHCGHTDVER